MMYILVNDGRVIVGTSSTLAGARMKKRQMIDQWASRDCVVTVEEWGRTLRPRVGQKAPSVSK